MGRVRSELSGHKLARHSTTFNFFVAQIDLFREYKQRLVMKTLYYESLYKIWVLVPFGAIQTHFSQTETDNILVEWGDSCAKFRASEAQQVDKKHSQRFFTYIFSFSRREMTIFGENKEIRSRPYAGAALTSSAQPQHKRIQVFVLISGDGY